MAKLTLVFVVAVLFYAFAEGKFVPKTSRLVDSEDGMESWAYVDVRENAHMFYWLYRTYHPDGEENRPWILWLQGGPGGSSCGYGNFDIIGPVRIDGTDRNTTWVNQASILFVDNPVGAGYSYVDDPSAYTTDVAQITADLTVVLQQVLINHPEFQDRPFYVFGQSYGGKMAAHFARNLNDEILLGNINVRLIGYAMGNAWISPIDSTLSWGPFLYWMSTVDENGEDAILAEGQKAQDAIDAGDWESATDYWASTEWVVIQQTNGVDFYNILKFVNYFGKGVLNDYDELRLGLRRHLTKEKYDKIFKPDDEVELRDDLDDLMNSATMRAKLLIIPDDVTWGAQSGAVFDYQAGDFMKPVVDVISSTLQNTSLEVIVYQGQLDLICDTGAAMQWTEQIQWPDKDNYYNAQRNAFVDPADGQTDMFVKEYNTFKFYWILRAGHAVPKDKGDTAYRMLAQILSQWDK